MKKYILKYYYKNDDENTYNYDYYYKITKTKAKKLINEINQYKILEDYEAIYFYDKSNKRYDIRIEESRKNLISYIEKETV